MHITIARKASAFALLAALAAIPLTEAHAQSANASAKGQAMGQGTPGGSNPNAGPGNNSGQGNTSPASIQASPVHSSASTSVGGGSSQTPGPEGGHNCGGAGHINNDAPGHQHDDCDPLTTGSTNAGAAAATSVNGVAGAGLPSLPSAVAGGTGAAQVTTVDCSLSNLTPLFGPLTGQEVEVLATAEKAAVVPVACPEIASNPEAQQAVAANPGLVRALEANGYAVHRVIAADVSEPVPTIYVEDGLAD